MDTFAAMESSGTSSIRNGNDMVNPDSHIEPQSFSKKEKGIFFIGLSLIAILKISFLSVEIEKIPLVGGYVLLFIDIMVFALVLKKTKFNRVLLLQCVLVACYIGLFFYLLSTIGKPSGLVSAIGQVVTPNHLLVIVSLALGAGVLEEILFRKLLFDFFQKGLSVGWAIFLASCAFFLMHTSLNPLIFLMGVIFSNVVLRFKSLIAVILLHGFYDFIGYLSSVKALQSSHFTNSLTASDWLKGGNAITQLIFFGLFIFYALATLIWKKFIKKNSQARVKKFDIHTHSSSEIEVVN